jgi:hypothetical protein
MITWKGLQGFFLNIQWKEGEREWNGGGTERESVCVREAEHSGKRKIASPIKLTVRE